jgi:O-antigen ligase
MADIDIDGARQGAVAGVDLDTIVRSGLFLVVLLVLWVSFHPFADLSVAPQELADSGDLANQLGFALLFLAFAGWMLLHDPSRLRPLVRPALVVMLAWFALSVVVSWEPALAARRLVFMTMVMTIAAISLLLPKNVRHFGDLLAAASLIVLALCYAGVLLVPDLAVHQATDVLEPEHAGSWRGVFPHKNEAGATMAVFVFIGLFVARTRNLLLGGTIVALSVIFLVFSHSKTAIALLPLVLIISALIAHARRGTLALTAAIGGLAALNLVSLGSIFSDGLREALGAIVDPSFTGRTDIWQFALDQLALRPITGYGFSAFWGTENVVYGLSQGATWATNATDAHNAYLNLAVTVGIPGLVLALVWMVVLPVADFYKHKGEGPDRALSILFIRIWLFVIYTSSFESSLFQPTGQLWFAFLMAIFGLRYLSISRVTA